jgi:hypothetical protein
MADETGGVGAALGGLAIAVVGGQMGVQAGSHVAPVKVWM